MVADLKKSSNHGEYLEDISHKQVRTVTLSIFLRQGKFCTVCQQTSVDNWTPHYVIILSFLVLLVKVIDRAD